MTIRGKLRLLMAGTAFLLLLAMGSLTWAEWRIGLFLDRGNSAFSILSGLAELNTLSNELNSSNIERVQEQWRSRADRLHAQIEVFAAMFESTEPLRSLERDFAKADVLFVDFVKLARQAQREQTVELWTARRFLRSHFSVVLSAVEADANEILEENSANIAAVQSARNGVLLFVFVVLSGSFLMWARFFQQGVISPLRQLHKGVLCLRDGELGCEVTVPGRDDEVSALGRAFNEMSLRLKVVTVSRDELQREMQERRRAETALRDAQRQVFAAGERERARIGRELHDGVCQDISAVRLHIGNILGAMGENTAEAVGNLRRINEHITKILEDMRRIVMDLRPATLDEIGLVATLRWKCRQVRKTQGIELNLEVPASEERIPEDMKGPLYRIVQEALNNVSRHSGATRVDVQLRLNTDRLELAVVDNGVGFDPNTAGSAGYGLSNMRERARAFDGVFSIMGSEDGTRLEVAIPLPQEHGRGAAAEA
ncbi:histidine kinase [Desulfobaculum sp. SPO524]|uniref:sensor histidine kinase n=1 Tax=Desulfobaculum sp. SPO524 TaxID=3378071 RepID=UPI003853238F